MVKGLEQNESIAGRQRDFFQREETEVLYMFDYLGGSYICFVSNINRIYHAVCLGKVETEAIGNPPSNGAEILWHKSVF